MTSSSSFRRLKQAFSHKEPWISGQPMRYFKHHLIVCLMPFHTYCGDGWPILWCVYSSCNRNTPPLSPCCPIPRPKNLPSILSSYSCMHLYLSLSLVRLIKSYMLHYVIIRCERASIQGHRRTPSTSSLMRR